MPSVPAVEAEKPPSRRALRKLLDRIRSQRNDWINSNSHSPAEDSPTCFTDLIPEKDTTIESGSLSNEPDRRTPVQLCEPTVHTPGRTVDNLIVFLCLKGLFCRWWCLHPPRDQICLTSALLERMLFLFTVDAFFCVYG